MQYLQGTITDVPSTERCAEALIEVVPSVMRTIRLLMRAERASDLSVPQFRALGYVRRHPRTSLSAVAEHLGLSVAAVSRLIDTLVARGLVARHTSESDRRYVVLELSAAGVELLGQARTHAVRALSEQLVPLDAPQRAEVLRAVESLRALFATPAIPPADQRQPGVDMTNTATAETHEGHPTEGTQ